jgi:hypothetical protein
MCLAIGHLPQPIAIFIPTAVDLHPDFGKKMMKQKASVPLKITKGLIMIVWFVSFGKRLAQGHCFGRFPGQTNMIKVNGVIEFVLNRDYHDGIAWNFLLNRHIDAEEKKDNETTEKYDGYYLIFLPHPLPYHISY